MNVFIHMGIDKFLDKQAVRDLLFEYDNDDIFIGGEESFYSSFAEEMQAGGSDAVNFSRTEKRRFLDVIGQVASNSKAE